MNRKDKVRIFINEIYSTPLRQKYPNNKVIYKHFVEILSIDLADKCDHKPSYNKLFRQIIIVIDTFSKYTWSIQLKTNYAQSITEWFSKILTISKRERNKNESDRRSKFYKIFFQNFLRVNEIHNYSRFTDEGPFRAKRCISTIRNLF